MFIYSETLICGVNYVNEETPDCMENFPALIVNW